MDILLICLDQSRSSSVLKLREIGIVIYRQRRLLFLEVLNVTYSFRNYYGC